MHKTKYQSIVQSNDVKDLLQDPKSDKTEHTILQEHLKPVGLQTSFKIYTAQSSNQKYFESVWFHDIKSPQNSVSPNWNNISISFQSPWQISCHYRNE